MTNNNHDNKKKANNLNSKICWIAKKQKQATKYLEKRDNKIAL